MNTPNRDLGNLVSNYGKRRNRIKVYLLCLTFLFVVLIFIWPLFSHKTTTKTDSMQPTITQEIIEQRRVVHPQYLSTDSHERPYKLTADYAEQENDSIFFLSKPQLSFILTAGNVLILTADKGYLDQEKSSLKLRENVVLRHQTGHNLHTQSADIDLKLGNAQGDDIVTGDGPMGALQAKGFRLYKGGEKIVFLGTGTLTIIPSEIKKKDQE